MSKHSNAADKEDTKTDKHGTKTISDNPLVSDGEEPEALSTQDTPTGISQVFGTHEDSDSGSDTEEDIPCKWKKQAPKIPKKDNPPKESSDSATDDEQLMDEEGQGQAEGTVPRYSV